MSETFPVIVYKQGDNLDDAWYLNDEINSIACCLLGIPGIEGRISFSDHTRYNSGFVDRTLHFTIAFKGHDGQIGSNFLSSCLEESRCWVISEINIAEISFSEECFFERNLTLVGSNRNSSIVEIISCVNEEIQKPKWEKYWNRFSLNFTGNYIKVK
jgi:hypothetical protein